MCTNHIVLMHSGACPRVRMNLFRSCPLNSPGKNTGVGCHTLLQWIFPTQGLNSHLCLLHWQAGSLIRATCSSLTTQPFWYLLLLHLSEPQLSHLWNVETVTIIFMKFTKHKKRNWIQQPQSCRMHGGSKQNPLVYHSRWEWEEHKCLKQQCFFILFR